jgi:hypothetical protein
MGQVGGKEAFDNGRKDLEVLAGLQVKTKAVERVSETLGAQIEQQNQKEQKQVLSGKVVCLASHAQNPNLYVAIDGSGVPVVARAAGGCGGCGLMARPDLRAMGIESFFVCNLFILNGLGKSEKSENRS